MGGRGGTIRGKNTAANPTAATPQPTQQGNTGTPSGYTVGDYQNKNDQEMHDFLIDVNDIDMPDFLNNIHMQKLEYALGMNDKPEVISDAELKQRIKDDPNLIPIYRSCDDTTVNGVDWSADDCLDDFINGDLSYIGNGVMGDGYYFSDSIRGSKAYGPRTIAGYLNDKAKVISQAQLKKEYDNWIGSHPASRRALGYARKNGSQWQNSYSQFALSQGYNVISAGHPGRGNNNYYNILDRSVVTVSETSQNKAL